ncbi:MAG: hypothetical protein ABJE95_13880 [Byssovorax sp.]
MSEPEVWIESNHVKLSRGRLGGRLGEMAIVFGAFVLGILANGLLTRLLGHSLGGASLVGVFGAPIATMVGLSRRRTIAAGPGAIGVVGGELTLVQGRKRKQIPLARLLEGRSSPRRNQVDLRLRGGDQIVAHMASSGDAERLLVAAGLDASKRTMRFELGETTFLTWMTFLLGPAVVLPATQAIFKLVATPGIPGAILFVALFVLLFVALFYAVRAAWGPAKLIVGADGVVVDRLLRDEFVPYARLASITMKPDRVTLVRDDGSRVRARARHLSDVQQGELRARLDAAKAAFDRGEGEVESLARLDRAGRTIDAWRDALRALLDHQGSYRETPLTREQLLAVLESPAASAERRLAAAVSLSAAGEPEIAARIRIAADACARPQVRIALDGVADGDVDDEAIEAAIAEDRAAKSPG